MGEMEQAVQELDEIIRSNPENIRARILLTRVLAEAGRKQEAATHLEFLGFMMPENDPALEELRELLEGGSISFSGVVDDPSVIDQSSGSGEAAARMADFSDTVTEVFDTDELLAREQALRNQETADTMETEAEPDDAVEPVEDVVSEEDVVTSHLPESQAEMTENEAETGVDIKTRTMALVYEKQGMYQDALDVLLTLREQRDNPELDLDIQRIRNLMAPPVGAISPAMSGVSSAEKIQALKDWLEKINAVS